MEPHTKNLCDLTKPYFVVIVLTRPISSDIFERFFKLLRHLLWGRFRKGRGEGVSPCTNHMVGLISSLLVNSGFKTTLDSRPGMDTFLMMFTVSSLVTLV